MTALLKGLRIYHSLTIIKKKNDQNLKFITIKINY